MVGNSDSKQIGHRLGFLDVESQLRLQSFMNLQTWNSIRVVDFLLTLPEVDPARIGITGASGGGTQSFILAAADERITAAFPAVMISVSMQGGCICENDSYLRTGTTNIELAVPDRAAPLGMTGREGLDRRSLLTKGLPELKKIYALYGAEEKVMAKIPIRADKEEPFPHNYNQPSREVMYTFFNKHFNFGVDGQVKELPFKPVDPKQLSVYDAEHPLPKDATNAEGLKRYLTDMQEKQMQTLLPKDKEGLAKFQKIEYAALRAMMTDQLPESSEIEIVARGDTLKKGAPSAAAFVLSRKGQGERVPALIVGPKNGGNGQVIVWVHPDGGASLWQDGKLVPAAQAIVDKGAGILAVEVFRTGEAAKEPWPTTNMKIGNNTFAGYFYGYNRALAAERVHDILTAVRFAHGKDNEAKAVHLVGFEKAGPWVVLARGLCGDAVSRTAADLNGFRFEQVKDFDDEMMLPGALKYGGLMTLAGTIAPHELYLHNTKGAGAAAHLVAAYQANGQTSKLERHDEKSAAGAVVNWLLR